MMSQRLGYPLRYLDIAAARLQQNAELSLPVRQFINSLSDDNIQANPDGSAKHQRIAASNTLKSAKAIFQLLDYDYV